MACGVLCIVSAVAGAVLPLLLSVCIASACFHAVFGGRSRAVARPCGHVQRVGLVFPCPASCGAVWGCQGLCSVSNGITHNGTSFVLLVRPVHTVRHAIINTDGDLRLRSLLACAAICPGIRRGDPLGQGIGSECCAIMSSKIA